MDNEQEVFVTTADDSGSRESSPEGQNEDKHPSMESLIDSESGAELVLAEDDEESPRQVPEEPCHRDTDEEVGQLNGTHHHHRSEATASSGETIQTGERKERTQRKKRRMGSRRERKMSVNAPNVQVSLRGCL